MADISTFSQAAETALSVLEHLCEHQIQKAAIWGSPSGKTLMASRIVKEIPAHKIYVEPFAGGGAVLFKKEPSQTEVINDLDPEIAFAFRFIKNITQEQIQALKRKKWVGDKSVFRRLRKSPIPSNPVDRFYRFAYLTRFAFNNLRDTATMSNDGVGKECGLMGRIVRNAPRLKNIKVRSTDYEKVIKEFDSPDTFFFLDPPYAGYDALPNAGKYHKNWDEKRFFNVVKQIKGKFLCTYGIRGDKTLLKGFYVRKWRHLSGVGGRESHTSQTFIISNYNPNTANRFEGAVEKTIWSSPAGKKRLAKQLADLLPPHKTYVEPFAGSAAVLFAKEQADVEVINDVDQEIVAAYQTIKRINDSQIARLRKMDWVGDEETFKSILKSTPKSDLAKLYRFLYLSNFSYGKARRSFSPSYNGITARSAKRVNELKHRLKNVVVSSGDYEQIVRKYDGKDTVFFFDPPYSEYRAEMAGGDFDEKRFFNLLKSIKGRFLMTYGERGELPSLLAKTNFNIEKIQTPRKARAMANSGPMVLDQLLVSNYELPEENLAPLLKAVWTTAYINDLPDSAFLYIESGGRKDEEGKTVPRALRHFPIRDAEGNLDLPHLRNAIARIPQARIQGLSMEDLQALQDKARRLLNETQKGVHPTTLFYHPSPPARSSSDDGIAYLMEAAQRGGEGSFQKSTSLIKGADPNDERYVLGIVLEPETVDAQGDIYSAEEIRRAAHKFMEEFGGLGVMHRFRANDQVKVLESFLAPSDLDIAGTNIKKGTWLLAVRVLSDELWKQVKDGAYTGFSIGGSAQKYPENAPLQDRRKAVSKRDGAPSDTTINRLKDMVVEEVSLVDRAANKRRFLIVKRSNPMGKRTTKTDISKADYQEAIEKLEALAAAGEALAEAGGEHASGLVALASRLLKVSESIAKAAEAAEEAGEAGEADIDSRNELDEALDSGADDESGDDAPSSDVGDGTDLMASMKTTLDRVNTFLDNIESRGATPPLETSPPKTEPPSDSQALSKDLKQVLDAVKKQQQRLARLEKQYGLPNSLPSGESRASLYDEDESWPRDLNAPVDRDSVDKSVSFHDVPRKGRR